MVIETPLGVVCVPGKNKLYLERLRGKFTLEETDIVTEFRDILWFPDGYPKSYLAPDDDSSYH